MSMTESAQWTHNMNCCKYCTEVVFETNTVDKNGHKTTSILMSKTTWPAIEPNFPPILSLSFNAFCSKAQVKMLFVIEWNPLFSCCTRRKRLRRRRTSLSNCFQRRRDWIEKWAWRKRVSTLKKMKKLPGWSIRTWVWIYEVLVSARPAQVAEDEVVPDVHSDQVGRVERGTVPSRSWHLL